MKLLSLRALLALAIYLLSSTTFLHGQELEKGWEYFTQNKGEKARESFEKALSGPNALNAHLALNIWADEYGNSKDRFQHLKAIYDLAENPDPYLIALWTLRNSKFENEELKFLEQIVEERKGMAKAYALMALAKHHRTINKFKESKKHFNKIGSITTWSVLGEFENISGSGFNKDFGALSHPEKDHLFTNKYGKKVKWFDIKGPSTTYWINMELFFFANNSVVYAQNFCNSPKEQEVQFRIGVSGSVKVWLNDHLLFSEEHERNNDLDSYLFTAKLMKGYNRILIQLGESEAGNCNFLLRITDDEGENIPELEFTTTPQPYPKNYSYTSRRIPNPVEAFFPDEIEKHPDNLGLKLALAEYYLISDFTHKAKNLIKPLRKKYPECTYFIIQENEAHQRDGNKTLALTLEEEVKRIAPESPSGLILRFEDAMDREDYDEAEAIVNLLEKQQGRSVLVYNRRIQLASEREEIQKMIALADEAYEAYPDEKQFVFLKCLIVKEVDKNWSRAAGILRKYLKNNYDPEAMTTLAELYFENGEIQAGLDLYYKIIENAPAAVGYYSELADVFFQLRKYDKARHYMEECINIAPYVNIFYRRLGKIYDEDDQKDLAIQNYQEAISCNPYDYEARKLLRQALGQADDVFEQIEQYDVYERFEKAPPADDFPEDNSIILLNDVQKIIYEEGGSEERHILLVKVFDQAGVDDWKEFFIPVYNNQRGIIEEMEVIKTDGKRVTAERNGRHVVFSNLEPGDAIYIKYRVENYYSGKLANHFWGSQYFSAFLPVQTARLSLLVPNTKTFRYLASDTDLIRHEKTQQGQTTLYTWISENVPAIEYEPYMPEFPDVAASVHYSSFPDWNYIADWYEDLAKTKARTELEVQEIAEEIFKDANYQSDKEKAEAIYRYIANNIRYRSVPFIQSGLIPQNATTTLSDRQGDCKDVSTLFVALCKTQNIPANLVLVNTRDEGNNSMPLPSINFNHCMAQVELEGKQYILELTSENLPFSGMWSTTENAFALPIPLTDTQTPTDATRINLPTVLPDEMHRQINVHFENDKMIVQVKTQKTGALAASIRNTYEHEGKDKRFKIMQNAISQDGINAKLLELSFDDNIYNNDPAVTYSYTYQISPAFTKISNLHIFKIPWAYPLSKPPFLTEEERKTPILLWTFEAYDLNEEVVTIQIPEGKTIAELPENLVLKSEEVEYSLTFKIEGNQLIATRRLRYLKDELPPEHFSKAREIFTKIIEADHQNLAFQ